MTKVIKNRGLQEFVRAIVHNRQLPEEFTANDVRKLAVERFPAVTEAYWAVNGALGSLREKGTVRRVRQGLYTYGSPKAKAIKAVKPAKVNGDYAELDAALDALVTVEAIIRGHIALRKKLDAVGIKFET
jgi:hypothetical protein